MQRGQIWVTDRDMLCFPACKKAQIAEAERDQVTEAHVHQFLGQIRKEAKTFIARIVPLHEL